MGKTVGRDAVISLVLKNQKYKCDRCAVEQHAMVVKRSNGSYFVCDDFQSSFYENNGQKPFKIHLRLNFRDGDNKNLSLNNIFALCPACTQKFLKEQKRDFRALALERKVGLSMPLVIQVKNFVSARCGYELTTRDVLQLIDLITQNK